MRVAGRGGTEPVSGSGMKVRWEEHKDMCGDDLWVFFSDGLQEISEI